MKKIIALLAILTLTVVSCKKTEGTTEGTTKITDTTSVAIDSVSIDSVNVDTTKVVEVVK